LSDIWAMLSGDTPDPKRPAALVRPSQEVAKTSKLAKTSKTEVEKAAPTTITSWTTEQELLAREKALFVWSVCKLAREAGETEKDACALVAIKRDEYPRISVAGRKGQTAGRYQNFRNWKRALGKTKAGEPDQTNWIELISRRGERVYQRPGTEDFWINLSRLYLNENRMELKYAHQMAVRITEGDDHPSYEQARWYYREHMDQRAIALARYGVDDYKNKTAGFISRKAPKVDEGWVGDHHVLDIAVKVWNKETTQWESKRPWLSGWMDCCSWFLIGYHIRTEYPDREAVELSLESGLERNNNHPPKFGYIDNGKDYKAMGFARPKVDIAETDRQVDSVFGGLGIEQKFALPYNSRAKTIERFFREVCFKFAKAFDSYRGSHSRDRSDRADKAWDDVENLPTLGDVQRSFAAWLELIYHETPSQAKGNEGRTPRATRLKFGPYRPALDGVTIYKSFLRNVGERTVGRGGVIRALNRDYRADELLPLSAHTKRARVIVKVDPKDTDIAWVYDLDGREICKCVSKPMLDYFQDKDDTQSLEQMKEEQKRQRRELRTAKAIAAEAKDEGSFSAFLNPAIEAMGMREVESGPSDPKPKKPKSPKQPKLTKQEQEDIEALDSVLNDDF